MLSSLLDFLDGPLDAVVALAHALVKRRREVSRSPDRDLRIAVREYDGRLAGAKRRVTKLEKKLHPSDPRLVAGKADLEAALADTLAIDEAWDAKERKKAAAARPY